VIPLVQCNIYTRGITFLAHPVYDLVANALVVEMFSTDILVEQSSLTPRGLKGQVGYCGVTHWTP